MLATSHGIPGRATYHGDLSDEGSTTMTDTNGNIDAAKTAARDAAEKVRETGEDTGASFGAAADEIADDLATPAPAAESDLTQTAGDVTDGAKSAASDVTDGAKSAASDAKAAASKAADAATDAVKAAGAKLKGVAGDVDFDELVAQTRTLTGGWSEKLKLAYRQRPAVVIGAAVGAVLLTSAIIRSIARR
jgi:hypothetical protein